MFDLLLQAGKLQLPAQKRSRFFRIAYERWGIARAGRAYLSPHRSPRYLLTGLHNLRNRKALTVPKVEGITGLIPILTLSNPRSPNRGARRT
jgi:hypothetical protein